GSLISGAVSAVLEKSDDFGTLSEYGLIYYRDAMPFLTKIVFVESSYLTSRITGTILILAGVFLVSLTLFFFFSLGLSKFAMRPIEEAMRMERQFVDDVSHDLKTPITVVLANASILKKNREANVGEEMQWIDSTEDAAKNMMSLVNEMLTLSSLESGRTRPERVPTDLSSAAEKMTLQFESVAFEQGIDVVEDLQEDVLVLATPEIAERIAGSLLENAFKYEPRGGKVHIELKTEKKKALLTVRNDSSRISEEDLPHVFERFYRADKTRDASGGHGLGLPILKEFITSVGGEIEVRSSDEEGTVFTVTLDLA
ncbi:MAG: HAMP domain-containing histidine kinase, partial [Lachnospiraceae bacterium]|nr:HAMP domain-containing histidine kinase [Lachnospiraceae bacterium]